MSDEENKMTKIVCICRKCKQETLGVLGNGETIVFDGPNNTIYFQCSRCNEITTFNFEEKKSVLDGSSKLPRIGKSNF